MIFLGNLGMLVVLSIREGLADPYIHSLRPLLKGLGDVRNAHLPGSNR